jgi:adenosylcobinamide-phosphate synthase
MRSRWVPPLALALDGLFGEPPTPLHPVVWIGTAISALERRAPRHGALALLAGAITTGCVVGSAASAGAIISRAARRLPGPLGALVEAWVLKTMLSTRALLVAGLEMERRLANDDLDGARTAARALVSRDVDGLTQQQLASAAIESLAENTADSIVAPLCFYAVGGLPAALAYRAAHTLDAMIGYRGEYELLGKASARLDDVLNLGPARLSAALLLAAGTIWGGDVPTGLAVTRRDHGRTASPNAGWPMSAMAGLLGTRLEKPGHYTLGADLPPPDLPAIDHAAELVKGVALLSLPVVLAVQTLADRVLPRRNRGFGTESAGQAPSRRVSRPRRAS